MDYSAENLIRMGIVGLLKEGKEPQEIWNFILEEIHSLGMEHRKKQQETEEEKVLNPLEEEPKPVEDIFSEYLGFRREYDAIKADYPEGKQRDEKLANLKTRIEKALRIPALKDERLERRNELLMGLYRLMS